jgi:hypothetical protein
MTSHIHIYTHTYIRWTDGKYVTVVVNKPKYDENKAVVRSAEASSESRPRRIDPVIYAKFIKNKKLGEGGQGAVYRECYM